MCFKVKFDSFLLYVFLVRTADPTIYRNSNFIFVKISDYENMKKVGYFSKIIEIFIIAKFA